MFNNSPMKLIHFMRNIYQQLGKNPTYDWYTALFCFSGLFCLTVIVNITLFFTGTMKSTVVETSEGGAQVTLSQADIAKAIQSIKEKDTGTRNISNILMNDPSL